MPSISSKGFWEQPTEPMEKPHMPVSSDAKDVAYVEPKLWHDAWNEESVAKQQLSLVYKELGAWLSGERVMPFNVFLGMLTEAQVGKTMQRESLLEIGCGVGHYGQLLALAGAPYAYLGVDVSPAMVKWARVGFPAVQVIRQDGESLDFIADNGYDIVVLGSVLNHTPDWEAMFETAKRIARRFVLLHRMPMYIGGEEVCKLTVKQGYGQEMAERKFNEMAMNSWCGVKVHQPRSWSHSDGEFQASYLVEV